MKTTMTISIDQKLKQAFSEFSKELGTNPTNLINMLMKNSLNNREINLRLRPKIELEIEKFTDEEIESFGPEFMEKTEQNTKKLSKLLENI